MRARNFDATLADLYDPLSMPPDLVKAHAALDRAVDLCYRPQRFQNDRQRVEHLFALYEKLTAPLIPPPRNGVEKRTRIRTLPGSSPVGLSRRRCFSRRARQDNRHPDAGQQFAKVKDRIGGVQSAEGGHAGRRRLAGHKIQAPAYLDDLRRDIKRHHRDHGQHHRKADEEFLLLQLESGNGKTSRS